VTWIESTSPSFVARHSSEDSGAAKAVLAQLEDTRERLDGLFERTVGELAVVLHDSSTSLALAAPYLPLLRAITAPAGRRYLVGWFGARELHVLTPELLAQRASAVPESREFLALAPAALYTAAVVGANAPALPPPFSPLRALRFVRWAWLSQGAAQYLSGQTVHVRPALARRLREGPPPPFPPGLADAPLLAGTLLDLLAREEGDVAVVALATAGPKLGGPRAALASAFRGRSLAHTEAAWRAHLARLAGR
jgi:hypothetical protein